MPKRQYIFFVLMVFALLVFFFGAGTIGWKVLTSESRLIATIEKGFHEEVDKRFDLFVEKAHITPYLLFSAKNGSIKDPQLEHAFLTWEEALVELHPRLFLCGHPVPQRITVNRPSLTIEYLPEKQMWNIEDFLSEIDLYEPRFRELLRDGIHVENAALLLVSEEVFGDKSPRRVSGVQGEINRKSFAPPIWEFHARISEGVLNGAVLRGVVHEKGGDLNMKVSHLDVTEEFLEWIPWGGNLEDLFYPRGAASAELDLNLIRRGDEYIPSWRGKIFIDDMQATSKFFDHRIGNLSGEIDIVGQKANFRDITGLIRVEEEEEVSFSPIQISGSTHMKKETTILHLTAHEVPMTENIIREIPESGDEIWSSLKPSGLADFTLLLTADSQEDLTYTAEVQLSGAEVTSPELPFRFEAVQGHLLVDKTGVKLTGVTAQIQQSGKPARIDIDGFFGMDGNVKDAHVKFRNLQFCEAILGRLPMATPDLWKQIRPSGMADGEFNFGGEEGRYFAEVNLKSGRADTDFFPTPIEDMFGSIYIDDELVRIKNLRGKIESDPLAASGMTAPASVKFGGEYDLDKKKGQFNVNLGKINLTEDIIVSIPHWGEDLWEKLRLEGLVSIVGSINCASSSEENDDEISYDLNADLENAGVQWEGFPLLLSSLQGKIFISDDIVMASHIEGLTCGGKVDIHGGVSGLQITEDIRYDGSIDFQRVDIRKLVRQLLDKEMQVAGKLSGVLEIAGRIGEEPTLRGRGEVSLAGGHIWRTPLFLELVDILHLSRPGGIGNFDRGQALYKIRDDYLYIEHFELRSPSAELTGWGSIGIDDGALDLIIVAAAVPEGGVPVLTPALKTILTPVQRELVRIKVSGTIEEPKFSSDVIGTLTRPAQFFYDFFSFPFRTGGEDQD